MKRMIELFAGRAHIASAFADLGWQAVAVDLLDPPHCAPNVRFLKQDVLTLEPMEVDFVWASPPCPQYSRHAMPWTRAKNPPLPDFTLWEFAESYCPSAKRIIENVKSAQWFHGSAIDHWGPFYLWGDVPEIMPLFGVDLMPPVEMRKKESYGSKQRAERATIPVSLARWIALSIDRTIGS